ncbi:Tyrosine/nicotianamine aminotransferase [Trema orientale]|uniref:Tyrosine/nicotianamine aminotransferase n=1 Tax=Trema orientale TaxID=63057 RepID=A0A2P5DNH8_TREOI|nr:Tyrosine/nicotianamine aminotransferase [Trema orientale]
MESDESTEWHFWQDKGELDKAPTVITIREVTDMLRENLNKDGHRPVVPLGHGDPSSFFRTSAATEDAIVNAIRSAKYNCYPPANGLFSARGAIAEYLSHDLPYKLSPDDVYLTVGCTQAIEIIMDALARPGANVLLPRPGFPYHEARARCSNLEVRHYDLLPEQGWEIDLENVRALSDENTVAMFIINPGNPCGSVYTRHHLEKVAEMARKLGFLVVADEAHEHFTFGNNPFVSMGVFGSIAPVLTVNSISKRWSVPGWRLGWLVTNDPNGILKKSGLTKKIIGCLNVSTDPPTPIQGAIPDILKKTKKEDLSKMVEIVREAADTCYNKVEEIPFMTCPHKPEGSIFLMVKLNVSLFDDINDDLEFCLKLAKEESVILLPAGLALGMKNWLRIIFAVEPSLLEDGLGRIKAFCQRHAKKQ